MFPENQLFNAHRFWQTKIHEGDRRGTKSQIEIGSDGDSVKDHADVAKASSEDSASKVMIHKCSMYILLNYLSPLLKDGDREYEEEEDDVRSLGDRDYQYGYGGSQVAGASVLVKRNHTSLILSKQIIICQITIASCSEPGSWPALFCLRGDPS